MTFFHFKPPVWASYDYPRTCEYILTQEFVPPGDRRGWEGVSNQNFNNILYIVYIIES